MKVILLIVICVLCSAPGLSLNTNHSARTFKRTTTRKIPITFIGTVKSIEPLGKRELQVIPVDFDARFAIAIHIESVSPTDVPLATDTDRIFAVHSPARLFGVSAEAAIGKKYRFKITWNGVSDKPRFSDLTID